MEELIKKLIEIVGKDNADEVESLLSQYDIQPKNKEGSFADTGGIPGESGTATRESDRPIETFAAGEGATLATSDQKLIDQDKIDEKNKAVSDKELVSIFTDTDGKFLTEDAIDSMDDEEFGKLYRNATGEEPSGKDSDREYIKQLLKQVIGTADKLKKEDIEAATFAGSV